MKYLKLKIGLLLVVVVFQICFWKTLRIPHLNQHKEELASLKEAHSSLNEAQARLTAALLEEEHQQFINSIEYGANIALKTALTNGVAYPSVEYHTLADEEAWKRWCELRK